MKRQIAKGLTMLMLIAGVAFASAAMANGQAGSQLKAQVPFDFVVAEKTLRSGQYAVRNATSGGEAIAITSVDGKESSMRLASRTSARIGRELNAKLVFHRYGNTYFLSQVWMAGESDGRQLPMTKQERAIERELKAIAAYRGETKPVYEIVVVVASTR